jgi:predicted porin
MLNKYVSIMLIAMGVSTAALAQSNVTVSSVQVYGIMDMGVMSTNHAGAANGGLNSVVCGIDQTCRLGFRASEDLGGGLKAGMQLESQIDGGSANGSTGSQGLSSASGSANAVFGRGANVFLEDAKLGKLTLGRQANAAWGDYGSLDGRKNSNFGSITNFISDGSSFGGTATTKTGLSNYTGSPFTSNTVRYDTPKFYGVSGTYARVFGNTAGDSDKSSADQYVVRYDNNGMFYGAVGQYKVNNSSGNAAGETTFGGVGARVTKDLTLTSSYYVLKNPASASASNGSFDLYSVGARYQVTPKVDVTTGIYQLKDNNNSNNGADLQSIQATYSFSKRTQAYVAGSFVQNKGATGIAAYGGGGASLNSLGTSNYLAAAGISQSAYALGLRHSF